MSNLSTKYKVKHESKKISTQKVHTQTSSNVSSETIKHDLMLYSKDLDTCLGGLQVLLKIHGLDSCYNALHRKGIVTIRDFMSREAHLEDLNISVGMHIKLRQVRDFVLNFVSLQGNQVSF